MPQSLKDSLVRNYIQVEERPGSSPQQPEKKMVDLLREDAKRFCTKEEAYSIVHRLKEYVSNGLTTYPDAQEIYNITVVAEEENPPSAANIGKWIDKNKGDRGYFAKATMGAEIRRVPAPRTVADMLRISMTDINTPRYVEEQVQVIQSFSATSEMPFNHLKIRLEPKFLNLTPEECYIAPILSRTHIRVFWAFTHFEYIDWESTRRIGVLDWSTDEAPLKDISAVADLIRKIAARFWSFVEEPIRAKWGPAITLRSPAPALAAEGPAPTSNGQTPSDNSAG